MMVAACESSDVRGHDKDRVFPTLRVVFETPEPEVEGERPGRFRQGLEIEASGTAGNFELDGGVGATDYRVLHGSAAYRFGFAGSRAQFFGLVGVGIDRLDLSDNPVATTEESFFGPMFGFEGRFLVREWMSPYVRLSGFVLEEGSHGSHLEAGLLFPAFERTEAFVAFRRWRTEYGNAGPFGRDLDLEWRGVVLGFGMRL